MDTAGRPGRILRTAEILAVGAELTVGETRDTNSGEIARSLTEAGVGIARIDVLPDRLRVVAGSLPGRPAAGRPGRLDRRPRADPR